MKLSILKKIGITSLLLIFSVFISALISIFYQNAVLTTALFISLALAISIFAIVLDTRDVVVVRNNKDIKPGTLVQIFHNEELEGDHYIGYEDKLVTEIIDRNDTHRLLKINTRVPASNSGWYIKSETGTLVPYTGNVKEELKESNAKK